MTTKMPQDAWYQPIPALRLKDGGAHVIVAAAAATRNAVPFPADTKVISICPTVAVFVKCGTSAVVAAGTDHYIPAGLYYDIALNVEDTDKNTHISVIRAETTDGVLYISEKV